jgi:hypothetical protein
MPQRRSRLDRQMIGFALLLGAIGASRGGRRSAEPADSALPIGPSFPVGGPTSAAWREEMLTKVKELSGLASWIYANAGDVDRPGQLAGAIADHLNAAQATAAGKDRTGRERLNLWKRFKSSSGGSSFERALGNLDAVEAHLLRLAPESYVRGQLPSLTAHVNRYLKKDDPRRERIDALSRNSGGDGSEQRILSGTDRDALVAAFHAANTQRRRDLIRVRSFRNFVVAGFAVLLVAAATVAVIGLEHRTWIPICFFPEEQHKFVCPRAETHTAPTVDTATIDVDDLVLRTTTKEDLLLVEMVGLLAAAVAAGAALRRMRGTTTPFGVPVALAMLKLPSGALTALLGLVLMRGGFVPGLSALDTSAQILAWAVVFGYAQQLFTRLIDNQAHGLLDDVGGHGAGGDRSRQSSS